MSASTNPSSAAVPAPETLATLTVNEVIARWPDSIAALNAMGIDTCCGGGATLRETAAELALAEEALVSQVRAAVAGEVAR